MLATGVPPGSSLPGGRSADALGDGDGLAAASQATRISRPARKTGRLRWFIGLCSMLDTDYGPMTRDGLVAFHHSRP
jgi:hypothetical protein